MTGGEIDPSAAAREAAARAALARIEAGMTIGLGSGRAVWRMIELIGERWPERPPIRSAFASDRTQALASDAGIEAVELDGKVVLDLASTAPTRSIRCSGSSRAAGRLSCGRRS